MDDYAHNILSAGQTTVSNYLLANYHQIGINNQELFIYLLIKGDHDLVIPMPEMADLHDQTGYSEQQLFNLFHQMIEKKLTKITQITIEGQQVDAYDFTPMYEKLAMLKPEADRQLTPSTTADVVDSTQRQAVFQSIEQEFGRTLSPIEMESISQWLDIDHYSPELIQLALKEAVLNQVYNLKYMDRIISNWYKKNLKTPAQVEVYKKTRKNPHSDDISNGYDGPDIPFINLSGNSNK
ncbi:DnaD domain-containing protein [Lentilactobacillus otakiensis]|uniref:DnaD domain-containing protein n=1 Tax=Lentilactobacillus otakiensis TaxID=481720 RepID=UPI003D182C49